MRRLTGAPFFAALVMSIAACGGPATTTTSPATTSPATASLTSAANPTTPNASSTRARAQTPGRPEVFPLTITRTGGVAGFQDVLVVAGDGLVSVRRKGQTRQCRLASEAVARIAKAAAGVRADSSTPASTLPSFPDDLITTVQSPAGGPVRLEDPRVGVGGPLLQVLTDLTSDPAASRMCQPL